MIAKITKIEEGCGARQAAGLIRSSAPRFALPNPQSSKGFSLVSAIFLLVVIAALGTFAVTLSTTQQQSAALDVVGTRAYHAARSGIEWGAFQVLPGTAGAYATACRAGAITQTLAPMPNTLAGFNVDVGCASSSHIEGAATVTMYQLTSTASWGTAGTPSFIERQISVSIAQ